jgi:hypothetical protein
MANKAISAWCLCWRSEIMLRPSGQKHAKIKINSR